MHTLPLLHTVRLGDGRTLRATGSAGSFVTAWLLEPTVNSTCVLAVTAPWSVRVYVAARETHGRIRMGSWHLQLAPLDRRSTDADIKKVCNKVIGAWNGMYGFVA